MSLKNQALKNNKKLQNLRISALKSGVFEYEEEVENAIVKIEQLDSVTQQDINYQEKIIRLLMGKFSEYRKKKSKKKEEDQPEA